MLRHYLFFLILIFFCFSCEKKENSGIAKHKQIVADNNASSADLQLVIENTNSDSLKIEAYNKLFFKTVYSDSLTAKKIYETLFDLGKKNPYAKARANNLEGIFLDVKGDYDAALSSYQKAIDLAEKKYPNIEGSAYNNIGLIDWNRGNYSEALTNYNKALALFEKTVNTNLQANALSNIGLIYMDIDNPETSDGYFEKSLAIRRQMNDEYGISVSLTNLAKSYRMQGRYKEAIPLYESAKNLKIKLNDEIGLSNTLYNQADCYYELGNFDKAISLLKRAEQLCIKNGSETNNLTQIYVSFGYVYLKTNQPEQLKLLLSKMKTQLDNNKDERNLKNYFDLLSKYYELENDYKNAFRYNKKSDSIYYKLEGVEVKNAINLYETQYQTAKKEKDLTDAQLKITEEKLLSKQKNIWLILFGSLILIGLGIFRNYSVKSKLKQKQLALENELLQEQANVKMKEQRLEISRDLHDSIGSQLTFINSILDGIKSSSSTLDDKINSKINTLSDFSENSIAELKSVLWVLNSNEIHLQDLKSKLLNLIQNAGEAKENLKFRFDFDAKDNFQLGSKQAVNLFRVTQEIINNAMKYAKANEIKISVKQSDEVLLLQISDDGIGFDLEKAKNKSFGLTNIQNRISELGGKVAIETSEGNGTRYNIEAPL